MGADASRYNNIEKSDIFNNEFMIHIDALYNFAYKLTLDQDEAKDLLQETFLRVWQHKMSYDFRYAFFYNGNKKGLFAVEIIVHQTLGNACMLCQLGYGAVTVSL